MTIQRDPDRPPRTDEEIAARTNRDEEIARRNAEIARRKEGPSFGPMPVIVTLIACLGIGYMAYSMLAPPVTTDTPRTTGSSTPRTLPVTPPATPATTPATK